MEIGMIGLDLARSAFQVHAIDAAGTVVTRQGAAAGADAAVLQ